ncbi:MAG: nucleotidyl transferase AbiEii/AbiGii toxin family protein [Thermoleophilia bacterium]|nr:nucleotidyl transferase AbiEii/AbiGii toxin family protein [Thermoleophilia bacterium]
MRPLRSRLEEAFSVRARFPWHRQPHTHVMVEISMDEQVFKPTPSRAILHEYGEALTATVRVYSMEEIVAEKLRAILQHVEMLNERGWSRSRARDFYDLWRILGSYGDQMDFAAFASFVAAKCAVRQVTFMGAEDFFQPVMLAHVQSTWNQWLEPLVPDLPPFETVVGSLRPRGAPRRYAW